MIKVVRLTPLPVLKNTLFAVSGGTCFFECSCLKIFEILEPCGLLPSTHIFPSRFSLAAQDGIRVFVGSCFIRAGQPPPIAPSALSDFRAVGRGGASRRLRRRAALRAALRAFGDPPRSTCSPPSEILEAQTPDSEA